MRETLEQRRLRLLFQPIVSLRSDPGEHYGVFVRARRRGRRTESHGTSTQRRAPGNGDGFGSPGAEAHNRHTCVGTRFRQGHDFFVKHTTSILQDPDLLP
ncbi:MAG: hypothetical protein M3329_06315 [Pseudomonadota bacterium]|nr:hypothetical protein [Pseudomonadota bacterium]